MRFLLTAIGMLLMYSGQAQNAFEPYYPANDRTPRLHEQWFDSNAYPFEFKRKAYYEQQLDALVTAYQKKKAKAKTVTTLHADIHQQLFSQYRADAGPIEWIDSGHYNCVGAAVAYAAVLEQLNWDFTVVKEGNHVLLKVPVKKGQALRMESARGHGLNGFDAHSSTRSINTQALIALSHYNEGIKEQSKQRWPRALQQFVAAYVHMGEDRDLVFDALEDFIIKCLHLRSDEQVFDWSLWYLYSHIQPEFARSFLSAAFNYWKAPDREQQDFRLALAHVRGEVLYHRLVSLHSLAHCQSELDYDMLAQLLDFDFYGSKSKETQLLEYLINFPSERN